MNFKKRKIILFIIDTAFITISCGFIFWLFYSSFTIDGAALLMHAGILILCLSAARLIFSTYSKMWRFAATNDYLQLVLTDFCGCCLCYLIERIFISENQLPAIYLMATYMMSLLLALCARFVYSHYRSHIRSRKAATRNNAICCAIVGAGYAGIALLDEMMLGAAAEYQPYCFFDISPAKIGSVIKGLRVYDMSDMEKVLADSPVTEIIIAIPSSTVEQKNNILKICSNCECSVKIYDFAFDGGKPLQDGERKLELRQINVADLLGRKQVQLDIDNIGDMLCGKTVLVTGGGGSIGSELCRQIAAVSPKRLIILDIYENNAYAIQQELIRNYGNTLALTVLIASVRDSKKINRIFDEYKPDIVFHAAAHKHVPLMESDPDEAVKNNILGTYNVANAAESHGVTKMILISSDKAVNPTNTMGATKRVCEMILQSKSGSKTEFAAVRFGNVLGSNGSVIPLFQDQIRDGGPVTLTDKRITRFFMTIPEAVSLVLEAGKMAKRGEVFVLDMGNPVRIIDLAENIIRLSGYRPYVDIDIVEIGLRPGEKLYEELLTDSKTLIKTDNEKIFIEQCGTVSQEEIEIALLKLCKAVESGDNENVRNTLKEVVPTYFDNTYYNDKVGQKT